MDKDEILQQFISITELDPNQARKILDRSKWDLEVAVSLYLPTDSPTKKAESRSTIREEEISALLGQANKRAPQPKLNYQPIPPSNNHIHKHYNKNAPVRDEDGILIPIPQKTEQLVDAQHPPYNRSRFTNKTNNVEPFRLFPSNNKQQNGKENTKQQRLSELYKPPDDITFKGSWEQVKGEALIKQRWIIVNVQDIGIFACQTLNRDTWSDGNLKDFIATNFVFWQVLTSNPEGDKFCSIYNVNKNNLPFIAVIHPTGELKKAFYGTKTAGYLLDILNDLLIESLNPFEGPQKIPSQAPEQAKRIEIPDTEDLDEDALLEMAIKNSLEDDLKNKLKTEDKENSPRMHKPPHSTGSKGIEYDMMRSTKNKPIPDPTPNTTKIIKSVSKNDPRPYPSTSYSQKMEDSKKRKRVVISDSEEEESPPRKIHKTTNTSVTAPAPSIRQPKGVIDPNVAAYSFKIRLPSGKTVTGYFSEHDKLEDIYHFVEDNLDVSEREPFKVHSFFPNKDFPRSKLAILQSGLQNRSLLHASTL